MPLEFIQKDNQKEENPEYAIWINNDGLLTSWILGTMTKEALGLIVGCNTTRQIWKYLEEHLLALKNEREMQLKTQLTNKKES